MVVLPVPILPIAQDRRQRRWCWFNVATRRAKRAWSELQPPSLYQARKEGNREDISLSR